MSKFACFFFIAILANISFPGTLNVIVELVTFIGIFKASPVLGLFVSGGLFLSVVYSILLYVRLFFGELKLIYLRGVKTSTLDISSTEQFILCMCTLLIGLV